MREGEPRLAIEMNLGLQMKHHRPAVCYMHGTGPWPYRFYSVALSVLEPTVCTISQVL